MKTVELVSRTSYMPLYDTLSSIKCAMMVVFCGVANSKSKASRPPIGSSDTWRDMYLTDPPITTAKFHVDYAYKSWGGCFQEDGSLSYTRSQGHHSWSLL